MFFILDSSIFMNISDIDLPKGEKYIVPSSVEDEIKSQLSKLLLNKLMSKYRIQIQNPIEDSKKYINSIINKYSIPTLSVTDLDVISLAYELSSYQNVLTVLTDDFGIQNVLKILKIKFTGLKVGEIKNMRVYFLICKACKYKNDIKATECDNCGNLTFNRRYTILKSS
jgi:endoribonuclease Nob1